MAEGEERESLRWECIDNVHQWTKGNNQLHNPSGPARVDMKSGQQEWYKHGKRHRIGGPAVVAANLMEWWEDGKRHRADGPAFVRKDGMKEWWYHGVFARRLAISPKEADEVKEEQTTSSIGDPQFKDIPKSALMLRVEYVLQQFVLEGKLPERPGWEELIAELKTRGEHLEDFMKHK